MSKEYGIPEKPKSGSLQNQPVNTNLTNPTNFKFLLPKIPSSVYFCTAITVPGQSCEATVIKSGKGLAVKIPGQEVVHGDLSFNFLVNEDLSNYKELQEWFRTTLAFTDFNGVANIANWMSNEAQIIFLSNKKTPTMRMSFYGIFPKNISSLGLNSADTDASNITATCTLGFTYYEMEPYPNA